MLEHTLSSSFIMYIDSFVMHCDTNLVPINCGLQIQSLLVIKLDYFHYQNSIIQIRANKNKPPVLKFVVFFTSVTFLHAEKSGFPISPHFVHSRILGSFHFVAEPQNIVCTRYALGAVKMWQLLEKYKIEDDINR